MNLNLIQICGRLTRDPELKALPTGTSIVKLSVATNMSWKGKDGEKKEETEFHNVIAFGKLSEIISKYFLKGDEIYVSGRLKTSTWEDKDTRKKMYRTEIIADKFEFGQKSKANQSTGELDVGAVRGSEVGERVIRNRIQFLCSNPIAVDP